VKPFVYENVESIVRRINVTRGEMMKMLDVMGWNVLLIMCGKFSMNNRTVIYVIAPLFCLYYN